MPLTDLLMLLVALTGGTQNLKTLVLLKSVRAVAGARPGAMEEGLEDIKSLGLPRTPLIGPSGSSGSTAIPRSSGSSSTGSSSSCTGS